jgi:acetyl/propionyl-CoA carboxylase alpha subunit
VSQRSEVSVHYDPLLAKLIASGETREIACHRAHAALRAFPILGIRTNVPLLLALLEHPRFIEGVVDTGFLDSESQAIRARLAAEPPPEVAAIVAASRGDSSAAVGGRELATEGVDPWISLKGARV